MADLKNPGAMIAETFVGACLTGGALLLGILGAQLIKSRKATRRRRNLGKRIN